MRSLALSLLSLAAVALHAANPITNGSFEKVTAAGKAPGWEFMGDVSVRTDRATDGIHALRLLRASDATGETGLNRGWELRSGEQGDMLGQKKGAIRFRYFAVAQDKPGALSIQIIPMTPKTLEAGGKRTVWRVPTPHVGDGKWHVGEFAYDYSDDDKVQWVHVSSRLHAPGELWLDQIEWLPEVDAVPQITNLEFVETKGAEGSEGTLVATIRNLGSKPMAAGQASMTLPTGLTSPQPSVATLALPPNESTTVELPVLGLRDAASYSFGFALEAGGRKATAELQLVASYELAALDCEALLVSPGKPSRINLLARNTGHVMVASVPCELEGPNGGRYREPAAGWCTGTGACGPRGILECHGPRRIRLGSAAGDPRGRRRARRDTACLRSYRASPAYEQAD